MWIPSVLLMLLASLGPWPVDVPRVTATYSPPEHRWDAGHRGVDFEAAAGDRVLAMAAGTVAFIGPIGGKPVVTLALPGPDSHRITYEPVIASVAVGQAVSPGQPIGLVAVVGGHCGGARGCLHVGLRTNDGYLDPMTLVRPPPAVLKPRWTAVRS